MNWLFKIAIFSAPIFIISLVVWFSQHKAFQRDFQTENVRFEQQFRTEWDQFNRDFDSDLTSTTHSTDPFLEEQKRLAEKYWQSKPEQELDELEKQLYSSINQAAAENATKADRSDLKKIMEQQK